MPHSTREIITPPAPEHRKEITVAVLPFENLSADSKWDPLCAGLSLDLVTDLSRFRSVNIISYHSSGMLRPDEDTESDAVQQLKTDYIIKGSFRHMDGRVRITTQLINTSTGALLWAEHFEGVPEDIFSIEENIVLQVANSLQQQLDYAIVSAYTRRNYTNISAYTYWLLGMQELRRGTLESDDTAREYFGRALDIDPEYSRAYTGLSLSYFNEWSCQIWDRWEVSQKGTFKFAVKAFELDPQDHISAMVLGRVYMYDGDYDTAEFYLRKSLQLNPNDTDTLIQVSTCLVFLGYAEEALQWYERAAQLNPKNCDRYRTYGAFIYFELGEYTKALSLVKVTPGDGGWVDMPAYVAAAWYMLGDMQKMQYYWNIFLDGFIRRVNKGRPATDKEAVEWMMRVNPHRGKSQISVFWDYIRGGGDMPLVEKEHTKHSPRSSFLFRDEGAVWRLAFDGDEILLPYSKGLQDIVRLLKDAGKEFHCSELMGAAVAHQGVEVLDDKARKQYQEKILELQEELARAEKEDNSPRIATLQSEYDELIEHLSRLVGLGGRVRKSSNAADKMRSAVTWRIRNSIRKIEAVHPSLARHLSLSIRTGTFCSYTPEKQLDWQF